MSPAIITASLFSIGGAVRAGMRVAHRGGRDDGPRIHHRESGHLSRFSTNGPKSALGVAPPIRQKCRKSLYDREEPKCFN
jgi:hypothetical protein